MIRKRSKQVAVMLFLLLALCMAFPAAASAATSYQNVTDTTVFDSKHSFSPRFISGVTTVEPFGGYNYESDLWSTDGLLTGGKIPIRLTSANKGKVGVIYHNVGEFQGTPVDMKITVSDWKQLRSPQKVEGKTSYPCVTFNETSLTMHIIDNMIKSPKFRVEFFDSVTGAQMSLAGHITFKDIDLGQFVKSDNFSVGYLSSDSQLNTSGSKVYSDVSNTKDQNPEDKRFWLTAFFNETSGYSFIFSSQQYEDADFSKALKSRGVDSIAFTGETFAPFETPEPLKSVDQDTMYQDETLTYSLSFRLPQESAQFYYSAFTVKDALPKGLTYDGGFSVRDDAGTDRTAWFSAEASGSNLTVRGKAASMASSGFYNKAYTVTFNVKIASGTSFSELKDSEGKVMFKNQASLTTKSGSRAESTKKSNTVKTELLFRIDTSTDGNGAITSDVTGISGGSDKQITYSPNPGYKVKEVLVDGKKVTPSGGKYTFSDIYDDHEIYVSFTPTTDNKITLTKRVHRDDVYSPYGTPTAIFKMTGTDLNGKSHTYHQDAVLSKDTLSGDYYTVTITFDDLTAGEYTASEVDTARYMLDSISGVSGGAVNNNLVNFDLVHNKAGKATFTNTLGNHSKFSHNDAVINSF